MRRCAAVENAQMLWYTALYNTASGENAGSAVRRDMVMHKWKNTAVIVLAYLHRYGLIAVLCVFLAVFQADTDLLYMGIFLLVYSVWTFVGYRWKWEHIYCSYQNAYHEKMTPNSIHWDHIKLSDAYGIPLIAFLVGLACVLVYAYS